MKLEELLKLDHLKIAEVDKFVHIHSENGFIITNWDEKDVKEYFGSECFYMPIRDEYEEFRVIELTKHLELEEERDELIKEEENKKVANE